MLVLGCSLAPWNWDDCARKYLGDAIQAAIGGLFGFLFDTLKKLIVDAVVAVLKAVGTLWVDIKTPGIGNNSAILFVQAYTFWILVFAATISVIIGGVRMAVSQRGEPLRDIMKSLLTMVVVSGAGVAFASTLITVSDVFSRWIIQQSIGESNFDEKLTEKMTNPLKDSGVGLMLVIVIGILMVISALVQLGLMVIRYGMLVLLVGVLPLTAAATNTEAGMMWFKRAVGWLAGFIIYKPVAALIYATAIFLIGEPKGGPDSTLKVITGVTMMLLAIVALPAILRFVSPRTGG
ncbi:TrbL/VirB6 plasmid conjugal transfer protein [Kribbella voronezhensis]|uniref:TrbL/VirB6 plasmid conjugal transfer protein n=1 Tax=Kribbella voronezhensis TaxID=2512212 RepID=A0A4R7TEX4_9ACTN|nr:hypothetical protein [Kribbella voronezhensis]TDU89968.1 TrbL/VirB6 plasmid conjugal transfer protein [Kribbella voronezhensis]